MQQAEELVKAINQGLLNWYDFKRNSTILYIGNKEDALAQMLTEHSLYVIVTTVEESCEQKWSQEHLESFDYIISIETLEQQMNPQSILIQWKKLLKSNGILLLGMNNRFGIRYFCGDRDIYTQRNFDSIEGYRRAYSKKEDTFVGRTYSKSEIKNILEASDFKKYRFYSVFSDLKHPNLIYAEDYLPNEDLANRVWPVYHYPNTVFLEEESLYGSLAENDMFHNMANAYLIECSLSGEFSNISHVTSSMERGDKYALITVVRGEKTVEKIPANSKAMQQLEQIAKHTYELKERGISVVDTKIENGRCVMPYIHAEVGQLYLKRLLKTDKEQFLEKLDMFRDLILQSSEIVEPDKGDGMGAVLRKGYLDMVPLNSFYVNGTFMFYDQEFSVENYPANAIIRRMITTLYHGNIELQAILPIDELLERYNLLKEKERWARMEWEFFPVIRNDRELRQFHDKHWRNYDIVNSNRQRMNYSDSDYQKLFINIFNNADTRKLILFGSGNFTKKFLQIYKEDYPVYAIIDNNAEKWGQEMDGVKIMSPKLLKELSPAEYKVLICIKNYLSVMKQLDEMGVKEYSIFDAGKDYPRKRKPILEAKNEDTANKTSKKYHTGYVAGVYDLFHIGHLNMFKRAKEQCEYLIVGVVSDEAVLNLKGAKPFIPCEERVEMIRSCRYVDEVVALPENYGGIREAYKQFHFDVQFSGNDHANDADWLAEKEYLESQGAELVFFPYTEKTSSTKIKALIERKLM